MKTARQAAVETLYQVIVEQRSLNALLPMEKSQLANPDRSLYQALVYGSLREYGALSVVRDSLLKAPLSAADPHPGILLNLGIYQLLRLSLADYGVINETVKLTRTFNCLAVKGLVNAILRRVQRERETCTRKLDQAKRHNLPPWLARAYPERMDALAASAGQHPPFTLRLRSDLERKNWCLQQPGAEINPLHPQAVTITPPCPVSELPGFAEGQCSVQDASAQWAATLLQPKNGEHILDACAAPGGKTGHLLELAPEANLLAIDHSAERLLNVQENLDRLHLNAQVLAADASQPQNWWDQTPFDAILLDAPCSGSGVLRRHPDIAFLRNTRDLQTLPKTQFRLLTALWKTLKPGGRLLYTTCSILPRENQQLIEQFLFQCKDARLQAIDLPHSEDTGFGLLHFPDTDGDGFFYALLIKEG